MFDDFQDSIMVSPFCATAHKVTSSVSRASVIFETRWTDMLYSFDPSGLLCYFFLLLKSVGHIEQDHDNPSAGMDIRLERSAYCSCRTTPGAGRWLYLVLCAAVDTDDTR